MIESINNDKVKMWTKLNEKKYQQETGLFLVEGEHLVDEAKKCGRLKEIIALEGIDVAFDNITYVSEVVMKKISSLSSAPKIIGIVEMLSSREIRGNVLLLDGVQDPGNVGTIIRSALAFGIDTIVLGKGTVSVYNPKVVRATEGLLFHINIVTEELTTCIEKLHQMNYKVYSTKVDGGTLLNNIDFDERTAIVVGSEGSGVSSEVSELCDEYLYIPMSEQCESLNVGVATSIVLYELSKQL